MPLVSFLDPQIAEERLCEKRAYCTDTTNPATAIAEDDDKRPADLVMTDDCRVDRQIW